MTFRNYCTRCGASHGAVGSSQTPRWMYRRNKAELLKLPAINPAEEPKEEASEASLSLALERRLAHVQEWLRNSSRFCAAGRNVMPIYRYAKSQDSSQRKKEFPRLPSLPSLGKQQEVEKRTNWGKQTQFTSGQAPAVVLQRLGIGPIARPHTPFKKHQPMRSSERQNLARKGVKTRELAAFDELSRQRQRTVLMSRQLQELIDK